MGKANKNIWPNKSIVVDGHKLLLSSRVLETVGKHIRGHSQYIMILSYTEPDCSFDDWQEMTVQLLLDAAQQCKDMKP